MNTYDDRCPKCGNQETVNVAETYRNNPEQYRTVHELLKPPPQVDIPPVPSPAPRHNERSTKARTFFILGSIWLAISWITLCVISDFDPKAGNESSFPYMQVYAVCGFLPALVCSGLSIFYYVRKKDENSRINFELKQRELALQRIRDEAIREKDNYHSVMLKYRNLYYCDQCDSVFNPDTGQHLPVGRIDELTK